MPSIDVVIPSVRSDAEALLAGMPLDVPDGVEVSYWIVSDRPCLKPRTLDHNGCRVTLVVNEGRLGAPMSRNVGIELGSADYVLFLDDDVLAPRDLLRRYMDAARAHPGAAGYAGPTVFPAPVNRFTRGVLASSMTTMFRLPAEREWVMWATTSNLMIPRRAMGRARFRDIFPAHGGGEDIDFCLQVGGRLKTVPMAAVRHGWWGGGRRSYRRFFRWAFGDSVLPLLHPRRKYYDAPNGTEALFIGLPALASAAAAGMLDALVIPAWACCVVLSEAAAEQARVRMNTGRFAPAAALESALIRASNDAGRLAGTLRRWRPPLLFARFDFLGTGEWIPRSRCMALCRFGAISGSLAALILASL